MPSHSLPESSSKSTPRPLITKNEFEIIFERVRNWGKWGENDVLGTLNYIKPRHVLAAAELIQSGRRVSMAAAIDTALGPDNPRPAEHRMLQTHNSKSGTSFATDSLSIEVHGNSNSHLDALGHVSYNGLLYNGRPASTMANTGEAALDVTNYASQGIVGRGVLIDVPAFRGVPFLEPGESVGPGELDAIEKRYQFRVGEGDILVFRTGHALRRRTLGSWDSSPAGQGKAGLSLDAIVWMHERKVAAFLPDGDGETVPVRVEGIRAPIHALQICAMGLAAADSMDLETLSATCESEGRWEFFVVVAPLGLTGGTGSLVNPIAIF